LRQSNEKFHNALGSVEGYLNEAERDFREALQSEGTIYQSIEKTISEILEVTQS
jgi:hypothetical protein